MPISTSFANHFLIAMPAMSDPNFAHTVIYICEHHAEGTVGLIINRPMEFPVSLVFDQMNIESVEEDRKTQPLMFGGPIQMERGFVIHRPMGVWRSSLILGDEVTITTSNDIIRAIAEGTGPNDSLITLGYAGWTGNQLEQEVMDNVWLVCPFKAGLLYDVPFTQRWETAGMMIGVNMNQLTSAAGHA